MRGLLRIGIGNRRTVRRCGFFGVGGTVGNHVVKGIISHVRILFGNGKGIVEIGRRLCGRRLFLTNGADFISNGRGNSGVLGVIVEISDVFVVESVKAIGFSRELCFGFRLRFRLGFGLGFDLGLCLDFGRCLFRRREIIERKVVVAQRFVEIREGLFGGGALRRGGFRFGCGFCFRFGCGFRFRFRCGLCVVGIQRKIIHVGTFIKIRKEIFFRRRGGYLRRYGFGRSLCRVLRRRFGEVFVFRRRQALFRIAGIRVGGLLLYGADLSGNGGRHGGVFIKVKILRVVVERVEGFFLRRRFGCFRSDRRFLRRRFGCFRSGRRFLRRFVDIHDIGYLRNFNNGDLRFLRLFRLWLGDRLICDRVARDARNALLGGFHRLGGIGVSGFHRGLYGIGAHAGSDGQRCEGPGEIRVRCAEIRLQRGRFGHIGHADGDFIRTELLRCGGHVDLRRRGYLGGRHDDGRGSRRGGLGDLRRILIEDRFFQMHAVPDAVFIQHPGGIDARRERRHLGGNADSVAHFGIGGHFLARKGYHFFTLGVHGDHKRRRAALRLTVIFVGRGLGALHAVFGFFSGGLQDRGALLLGFHEHPLHRRIGLAQRGVRLAFGVGACRFGISRGGGDQIVRLALRPAEDLGDLGLRRAADLVRNGGGFVIQRLCLRNGGVILFYGLGAGLFHVGLAAELCLFILHERIPVRGIHHAFRFFAGGGDQAFGVLLRLRHYGFGGGAGVIQHLIGAGIRVGKHEFASGVDLLPVGLGGGKHLRSLRFGFRQHGHGVVAGLCERFLCFLGCAGKHRFGFFLCTGENRIGFGLRLLGCRRLIVHVTLQIGQRLRTLLLQGRSERRVLLFILPLREPGEAFGGDFRLRREPVGFGLRLRKDGVGPGLRFAQNTFDLPVCGFQLILGLALGVHHDGIRRGIGVLQQLVGPSLGAFEDGGGLLVAIRDQIVHRFFGFLLHRFRAFLGCVEISVGKHLCRGNDAGVFGFGCGVDLFGLQYGFVDDAVGFGADRFHLRFGVADDLRGLLLCGGNDHIRALLRVIKHVAQNGFVFSVFLKLCGENAQLAYHASVFGKNLFVVGSDLLKRLIDLLRAVGIALQTGKGHTFDLRRCKHYRNFLSVFGKFNRELRSAYACRLTQRTYRCFQARPADRPSRLRYRA